MRKKKENKQLKSSPGKLMTTANKIQDEDSDNKEASSTSLASAKENIKIEVSSDEETPIRASQSRQIVKTVKISQEFRASARDPISQPP
jgi:hypothetical protein